MDMCIYELPDVFISVNCEIIEVLDHVKSLPPPD